MKHVKRVSKKALPVKAVFIVSIESKDECKSNPNVDSVSACKTAVKNVGVYEILV